MLLLVQCSNPGPCGLRGQSPNALAGGHMMDVVDGVADLWHAGDAGRTSGAGRLATVSQKTTGNPALEQAESKTQLIG